MQKLLTVIGIISITLISCSKKSERKPQQRIPSTQTNAGRYQIAVDRAPDSQDINVAGIKPWEIKSEPKSKYGNHSPYVVFGKTYHLQEVGKSFEQTGTASWYGKKFHGHTTSNMEIFDMYKMTAAHRTLPLPSYVEVTNLDNNKKVIVRVNDRGPFKSKRIIDLSWAAAKALDYDTKGLANVHIRLINPDDTATQPPPMANNQPVDNKSGIDDLKFLQVGAFSEKNKALEIAKQLSKLVMLPVHVTNTITRTPLYRVRIGPLMEDENIIDIIGKVHKKGFLNTKMVVE